MALVAVAVVWLALLGSAYAALRTGASRTRAFALVACCYAVLAGLALVWLGLNGRGLAGVAGMLLPLLVAGALIARARRG